MTRKPTAVGAVVGALLVLAPAVTGLGTMASATDNSAIEMAGQADRRADQEILGLQAELGLTSETTRMITHELADTPVDSQLFAAVWRSYREPHDLAFVLGTNGVLSPLARKESMAATARVRRVVQQLEWALEAFNGSRGKATIAVLSGLRLDATPVRGVLGGR